MTTQYILDNTKWIVKFFWGRQVMTGKQLNSQDAMGLIDWDEVKDVDFCCEQTDPRIQQYMEEFEDQLPEIGSCKTWPEFVDFLADKGVLMYA